MIRSRGPALQLGGLVIADLAGLVVDHPEAPAVGIPVDAVDPPIQPQRPGRELDLDRLALRQRAPLLAGHPLPEARLNRDQRRRVGDVEVSLVAHPHDAILDQLDPVGLPYRRVARLAPIARSVAFLAGDRAHPLLSLRLCRSTRRRSARRSCGSRWRLSAPIRTTCSGSSTALIRSSRSSMNRCGHVAYPSSDVGDTGASAGINAAIAPCASVRARRPMPSSGRRSGH